MLYPHRGQLFGSQQLLSQERRGEERKRRDGKNGEGRKTAISKLGRRKSSSFWPDHIRLLQSHLPNPPQASELYTSTGVTSSSVIQGVCSSPPYTPKYCTATVQGSLPDPKGAQNITDELECWQFQVPDAQSRVENTSSTCSNGTPHFG